MYVEKVLGQSMTVMMPGQDGTVWVLYADGAPLAVEVDKKRVYSAPVRGRFKRYLRAWLSQMRTAFPDRFRSVRFVSHAEVEALIRKQVTG